jgi:sugar phosphate isomerase/epimerase
MVDISIACRVPLLPDPGPLLATAGALGVNLVEVAEDLSKATPRTLETCRRQLIEANRKIVLLDSPVPADDGNAYRLVLRHAALLGIDCVKVPAPVGGTSPGPLREVCRMARAYGIRILLENASDGPLSTDEGLEEVFAALAPETAGWILDPRAIVRQRRHPFFHDFTRSRHKNDIAVLRLRDGRFGDGAPTPLGQGDAEIRELVSILLARSFRGPFSIVPDGPGCGPDAYRTTLRAFKDLLLGL